jgi:hypothetical protein
MEREDLRQLVAISARFTGMDLDTGTQDLIPSARVLPQA